MLAEIDLTQIVVSLFTLLGVIATSYFSFRSHRTTRAVNDAVNNVHKTGGERIYDLVLNNAKAAQKVQDGLDHVYKKTNELLEWKRSNANSPWNSGAGVQEWLKEHNQTLQELKFGHCSCSPHQDTTEIFAKPNPVADTEKQNGKSND
jgi:hypothetical protein